jgi:hypothetical protein
MDKDTGNHAGNIDFLVGADQSELHAQLHELSIVYVNGSPTDRADKIKDIQQAVISYNRVAKQQDKPQIKPGQRGKFMQAIAEYRVLSRDR